MHTYERGHINTIFSDSLRGRYHFGDIGVNGIILLN
jgi:hypothetical protein